jgi:hypothetical protein
MTGSPLFIGEAFSASQRNINIKFAPSGPGFSII